MHKKEEEKKTSKEKEKHLFISRNLSSLMSPNQIRVIFNVFLLFSVWIAFEVCLKCEILIVLFK